MQRIVTSLADELRRASSNVESSTSVERITRLTRRIISMYIPQETDSLSSHELRTLATSLSGSSLEQSRSLGSILNLLASLEDIAYAPLGLQTQQQEHVLQIQQSIDQLVRRHPLR